jgi:hypothetical protein
MSTLDEKVAASPEIASQKHSMDHHDRDSDHAPPTGWMYQERRIGPLTIPYYASPKAQLILIAFVCFLCPGTFARPTLNSLSLSS